MSPMCVKLFKKTTNCKMCRDRPVASGRKFCAGHLREARDFWMAFSLVQRAKGRCSYCRRRNVGGGVRCGLHRARNAKTCQAWLTVHRAEHYRQQKTMKEAVLASGRCICKERNPLPPGLRRCDPCRALHNATHHRASCDKKKVTAQLRAERAARLERARQATLDALMVRYPTLSRLT